MRAELRAELDRLHQVLRTLGQKWDPLPGVDDAALAKVEAAYGLPLDPDLRALWRFTQGSASGTPWFCVRTDELALCELMPPDEVLEFTELEPLEVSPEQHFEWAGRPLNSDPRVGPFLRHPRWLPFAEFNGLGTTVLLDGAPGPEGKPGQIIAFQHDPDAVYFTAGSFLEFFAQSNALYEAQGAALVDEPDEAPDDDETMDDATEDDGPP